MSQLTRCVQIVLTLLEVSTIPDIVQCHRRHCGYTVGQGRWLADSVIRIDAMACVLYPHCNLMECANCVSCVSASYLLDILPVMHGNKCAPQKRGMSVKRTFLSKGRANDTDFDKNH